MKSLVMDAVFEDEVEHTSVYDFHGMRIAVSSDAALAVALQARLGRFSCADPGVADMAFTFCSVRDPRHHTVEPPPGTARPVYDSAMGDVLYDDDTDCLYIICGDRVRLRCDATHGRVQVSIVQARADDLWLLSHPLLTLPLMELAKRRGLYSLHAAGVAIGGRCLLFPGASGSGKSTLFLALARRGWDLLGDDLVFLAPGQDRPRALAFPEAIDVTDHTLRLFPELQDLWMTPQLPGWPKRQLRLSDCSGSRIAWDCEPAALVFPRVASLDRTVLTPIDRDSALLELVPNILLTEVRSSQAHMEVLSQLVRTSACYRLETGRDFDALGMHLRGLVE